MPTEELAIWNKEEALERLSNNEGLLKKVVQAFLVDAPKILDALKDAVETQDTDNVRLQAHSIKGSAGNVGAQLLQHIAKTVEFAAKEGDSEGYRAAMSTLESVMMETLESLKPFYGSEEDKTKKKTKKMSQEEMLSEIERLKNDIEAGKFIETDTIVLFEIETDDETSQKLDALKEAIDAFDTMKALTEINSIIRRWEQS